MSKQELELEMRAANPVARRALAALDLTSGEEALGQALAGEVAGGEESTLADEPGRAARGASPRGRRPRRALVGLLAAAAIVVAAIVLLAGGGGAGSPTPAYGARLVRFAESTPLLLLEAPGWHVNDVDQIQGGSGEMKFGMRGDVPADERRVDLHWLPTASLGETLRELLHPPIDRTPGRRLAIALPALDATAHVDTRAESALRYGRPGDHEMWAIWTEGSRLLLLTSRVPSLAAFRERLEGLRRVDAATWLDAMPAEVVKSAEYGATAQAMLRGIPLPPGFDPNSIPDLELTTDRYQVGAKVGGAVACAWFARWGEARAAGDAAGAREAEKVLLESEKRWPIFREMATEGGYPATIIEYAEHMRSGSWFGKPLLQAVDAEDGLSCDALR
jgi:hypothetical protein